MWMVRAGKNSMFIDDFEKLNVVAVGWGLGDLTNKTPDEIKELVYKHFPNNSNQSNGKIAANEIKLRHEIKEGDYVLSGEAIGTSESEIEFSVTVSDLPLDMKWLIESFVQNEDN